MTRVMVGTVFVFLSRTVKHAFDVTYRHVFINRLNNGTH